MLIQPTALVSFLLIITPFVAAQPNPEIQLEGATTDSEASTGPVDPEMPGVTVCS
jgi:hypothetical protein